MLGFFPKEAFLEPLCKILIFHGLCSERSFGSFFKNHYIFVDNKLVENPKILVDRESVTIRIEKRFCGGQGVSSREAAFVAPESASAAAVQAFSSREAAPLSNACKRAPDCTVLPPQSHLYILMNKPKNCVCSRVSDSAQTVYQVLEEALVKMGLFSQSKKLENQNNPNIKLEEKITEKQFNMLSSLGRLDKDTTGLLLFSTNGSFIHFVTDVQNKIAKTYRVTLKKALTKEEQALYEKQLESGIMLEAEKKAKPAFVKNQKVQWERENSCLFTIEQGIFHQVRRSFAALGNEVVELHRVKIGDLEMPADFQSGNVKILLKNDIAKK